MKTSLRYPAACLVAGLLALVLAGCSMAGARQVPSIEDLLTPAVVPTRPPDELAPPMPPDVMRGAVIYAEKCAACHGETGMADGPRAAQVREQGSLVPRISDPDRQRVVEPRAWFDLISQGRIERLMPGFAGSLSPQDRWDVLAYVWALGVSQDTLQRGQAIYTQQCESCHGAQGRGDGPQAGGSAMASFSDPRWLAETSLSRIMRSVSASSEIADHLRAGLGLDDDVERLAVAQYVRSFGYAYASPDDARAVASMADMGDGVLTFVAENRTPGGATPTGLPVTLRVYGPDSEVLSRTAPLDDVGVVVFSDLPVQPDYFYQPEMIYEGAKFFAAPAQFTETRAITGVLPVYEVTADPSVIRISELHFFVQSVRDGFITMVEFYLFDNTSDRAYISQAGEAGQAGAAQTRSVRVSLPAEATNLRFDGPGLGQRFVRVGGDIYDMDAVGPGVRSASITMLYDVPYRGSRAFERNVYYDLGRWDVLLPESELRVLGLVDRGAQQMTSGSIRLFEPAELSVTAGGAARFELAGQPRGTPVSGDDGRAIALGLIGLAVALALAYLLMWRAKRATVDKAALAGERQRLLYAIAELDQQREAGRIKESVYQKRRASLKEQLRDIWE